MSRGGRSWLPWGCRRGTGMPALMVMCRPYGIVEELPECGRLLEAPVTGCWIPTGLPHRWMGPPGPPTHGVFLTSECNGVGAYASEQ